jgi:hypothetical protein
MRRDDPYPGTSVGTDWDLPVDPLFLSECQVKVTDPDGAIGYGHIERSTRRSCMTG